MIGCAPKIRDEVERVIKASGRDGMTDDEIEVALGLRHQTASARRRELELMGRVFRVGTRATRSGRQAGVYVHATRAAETFVVSR
jgi:predicted transcriptional regulator